MLAKISSNRIYIRVFFPTLIGVFKKVWKSFRNRNFPFSPCKFQLFSEVEVTCLLNSEIITFDKVSIIFWKIRIANDTLLPE